MQGGGGEGGRLKCNPKCARIGLIFCITRKAFIKPEVFLLKSEGIGHQGEVLYTLPKGGGKLLLKLRR